MNELEDLGESLEASVAKDGLYEIIATLADSSLELVLTAGDAIPFFSYFTKGIKSVIAVKEYFFYEKVIEFMKNIGKTPTSKRLNMIEEIQSNVKFSEKFGKASLIILDRFDDKFKATLLGRVAVHLTNKEINFEVYKRFAYVIDRLYKNDILNFATHIDMLADYKITNLEALGLINREFGISTQKVAKNDDLQKMLYNYRPDEISIKRSETYLGKAFRAVIEDKPINAYYSRNTPDDVTAFGELLNELYG